MDIPGRWDQTWPILQALDQGGRLTNLQLIDAVAEKLGVTKEQRQWRRPDWKASRSPFEIEFDFAIGKVMEAKLIHPPGSDNAPREITPLGHEVVSNGPVRIDFEFLKPFLARNGASNKTGKTSSPVSPELDIVETSREPEDRVVSSAGTYHSESIVFGSTNLILYGPPGTGKTFSTAAEAVRLCDGVLPQGGNEAAVRRRYDELVNAKQVYFVTFHQSYSYEDFVEGLRPTTREDDGAATTGGFRLEPVAGVFREIATLAEQARKSAAEGRRGNDFDLIGRRFWKMGLGFVGSEEHVYRAAIAAGYVALGWGQDVDWSDSRFASLEEMRQEWEKRYPDDKTLSQTSQPWVLRNKMKTGDLVIVPYGNSAFRAIAEVLGDYYFERSEDGTYNQRRKVRWLLTVDQPLPLDTIVEGNFTMRALYEIPEQRIHKEALIRLISRPTKGQEPTTPDQFVLIIDEINRADISKVFGELITLVEPDKRIGGDFELKATLPYSKVSFGVPDNLHIVGTMNTADRSIALLDTALRRRFAFRELMPQPELLRTVDGIQLDQVLATINERIEYLFDREHQIGHAYFIRCTRRADVDDVMRRKVIPLLAEYFYDDWNKVAAVLGDADEGEGNREGGFLDRWQLKVPTGLGGDDDSAPRYRWKVRDTFNYAKLQ